jgi:hypothetical protein
MAPLPLLLPGHYQHRLRRRQNTPMPSCLHCECMRCHSRHICYTNKPPQPSCSRHQYQRATVLPPMSKLSSSHHAPPLIRRNERETYLKRLQSQTKKRGAKVERALQLPLRGVMNHNRLWLTAGHSLWTRDLRHSQTQGHPPQAALSRDPPPVNYPDHPVFRPIHDHSVAKASQTVTISAPLYRRSLLCRYSQKNQRLSQETRRLYHV